MKPWGMTWLAIPVDGIGIGLLLTSIQDRAGRYRQSDGIRVEFYTTAILRPGSTVAASKCQMPTTLPPEQLTHAHY